MYSENNSVIKYTSDLRKQNQKNQKAYSSGIEGSLLSSEVPRKTLTVVEHFHCTRGSLD